MGNRVVNRVRVVGDWSYELLGVGFDQLVEKVVNFMIPVYFHRG